MEFYQGKFNAITDPIGAGNPSTMLKIVLRGESA